MKTLHPFPAAAVLVRAAVVGLLLTRFSPALRADEDEDHAAAPSPNRVTVEGGTAVVRLQPDEIKRAGVATAAPAAASRRPSRPAFATVLDLQPLLEGATGIAAAQAEAAKTAAELAAARTEYERARQLNAQEQNVSQKDLDSAEAAWRGAQAARRAAVAGLQARRAALAQQWGSKLAGWIEHDTPEYRALLSGESRLVRVVEPGAAYRAQPPAAASVQAPDGQWVEASLISPAGQATQEFQTTGYYFLAPDRGGLLPGLVLAARLPAETAAVESGALIPAAAVVWWQGRMWIYQQTAAGVFARRELSAPEADSAGGYFVAGFPTDRPIVTQGAQVLLSEETKPAGAED